MMATKNIKTKTNNVNKNVSRLSSTSTTVVSAVTVGGVVSDTKPDLTSLLYFLQFTYGVRTK